MIHALVSIAGGVGVFLLGMTLLTDGLKALAGGGLRHALSRLTTSPLTGAIAGAATTALIQSSSAVTVTVVGFVGAGLLTFAQAIGVIFGANIGTTATGWLVTLIGFKLELGLVVAPLVLVGVLMRLFGAGRLRDIGLALAGFSLLFAGIDILQRGMAPLEGLITPTSFPPDTLLGRAQLVGLGAALTLVTQSSSAGVALALTALGAGAISFPQAAALAIGMDVGTTFTAALATIGGATASRRAGYAHVVYNLMTGLMAFLLLDLYSALASGLIASDPQIALVAFHSSFNALGVALALPFASRFARLIERMVPETGPPLLSRLDERLQAEPASAVDAAMATLDAIARRLLETLHAGLSAPPGRRALPAHGIIDARQALDAVGDYIERIRPTPNAAARARHVAAFNILDHLIRLAGRMGQTDRVATLDQDPRLRRLAALICEGARRLDDALAEPANLAEVADWLDRLSRVMRAQRRRIGRSVIESGAESSQEVDRMIDLMDSARWTHRTAYHLWRIALHRSDAGASIISANVAADAQTGAPAGSASGEEEGDEPPPRLKMAPATPR